MVRSRIRLNLKRERTTFLKRKTEPHAVRDRAQDFRIMSQNKFTVSKPVRVNVAQTY